MTHLFCDIETVPGQAPGLADELAATIKPPGTLRKPESIAAWERDEKPAAVAEAVAKTSFDAAYGQIVVISWAVDDGPTEWLAVKSLDLQQEREMLRLFFATLRGLHGGNHGTRPTLVGHNLAGFDLPFIWRRAVVHRVRPPLWFPRNPKPWTDAIADTMRMWAGDRDGITLDKLCKTLGVPGKDGGPTGADVWPMVQAGRMDEVVEYCRADVERTRACYRRMMFEEA